MPTDDALYAIAHALNHIATAIEGIDPSIAINGVADALIGQVSYDPEVAFALNAIAHVLKSGDVP